MADQLLRPRCPICGLDYEGELPGFCSRPTCRVRLLPRTDAAGATPTKQALRVGTFGLVDHFSLCVLPFSFANPEDRPIWQRLAESGRWKERTFAQDNPDDIDRTEYFLPYIRRFLFPGLYPAAGPQTAGTQSCRHFVFDLSRLGTTTRDGLPLTMHARDSRKALDCDYALLLEKVELIVFRYRVGFLVLHFQNTDPGATYFEQMNALAYLRTIAPLYRGFTMPVLAAGERRYSMPQLLPFLLAEFGGNSPGAGPQDVAAGTPLPVKPVYDDRMMVYAFSCLEKDTVLEDAELCEALLRREAIINLDPAATTRSGDTPVGRHARRGGDWLHDRRHGYSKDGGLLVVFNTDRYHARFLGGYWRTYYFDIFLLAALQRVTLLTLFESFSDINALITASGAGRKLLKKVRRELLFFKTQCWFSQITNRERGLVLWKQWQKVFENRTLLKEVNEQSEELNNFLQARYRERIEWLVRLGSFLAAVIPTVLGLERFLGQSPWVSQLRWTLLGVLFVGAAIFGYFVLLRPSDEV
jgi:hypothetical protein